MAGLLAAAVATTSSTYASGAGAPAGRAVKDAFDEQAALAAAGVPPSGDIPAKVGNPPTIEATPAASGTPGEPTAPTSAPKQRPGKPDDTRPKPDPDTLLVTFDRGTGDGTIDRTLDDAGVSGHRLPGTTTVEVALGDHDRGKVTAALKKAGPVRGVEPNLIRHISKVPNDPGRPAQDGWLNAVGAPTAWDTANTGAAAVVAVIDTGADLDHPDLKPNLVAGFDFVNNDAVPMDDNGHGTATSGVIGAATNNGVAVAGVAWNAKIMPVKVVDADGFGNDADLAAGIRWATDHHADIINMSLGGFGKTQVLADAVAYAVAHNVVVVAAAGNESSNYPSYPAAFDGVLAVSATDNAGSFAWFSNWGLWVDLAAPGINVRTTTLAGGPAAAVDDWTGTSFSSPIVAGVAALVAERHPNWTASQIADRLTHTANDAGDPGFDTAFGYGIVNAAAALGNAPAGAVHQPNLSGDAGDVPSAARSIPANTTVTESMLSEGDIDWFSFTVPAGGVKVTVTPPAASTGFRAKELDPIIAVHGPGGGRLMSVDDALEGQAEHLEFNAGAGTYGVMVVNHLASASPAAYTVRVDTGLQPMAGFADPIALSPAGSVTTGPVVADVNADSFADLVFTDGTALTVMARHGDGTYTTTAHPLHGTAVALPPMTGDFDGDGDTDIAVGTSAGLDVEWQSSGSLSAPVQYAGVSSTSIFAAANLDSSPGATEIVAGTRTGSNLVALRWNGTSFTSTSIFTRPTGSGLVVGDVTHDGLADVVTFPSTWAPTSAANVTVRRQLAGGSWSSGSTVSFAGLVTSFSAVTIGNVTGDTLPDIVLTGEGVDDIPPLLSTMVQAPDGTIGDITVQPIAQAPSALQVADVTRDGRLDAVMLYGGPTDTTAAVSVLRQVAPGRLTYSEETIELPDGHAFGLGLGDVDHDTMVDIAAGHEAGVQFIRQDSAVLAREHQRLWVEALAPAMNATGVTVGTSPTITAGRDLDASSVTSDTAWLVDARNNRKIPGSATGGAHTITIDPTADLTPGVPYMLRIDGVKDTAGNSLVAWYNFATAPAAGPPSYPRDGDYKPVRGDFDGNGYDDILWYSPTVGSPEPLWLFDGDGKVDATVDDVQGSFVPLAGDFDGNGYDDILWYTPGTAADVMWSFGPPSGGAVTVTTHTYTINGSYIPLVGDYDRNGCDDIFWYGPGAAGDSLWKFKVAGGYVAGPTSAVNGTYKPVSGDFNRDGYSDVFWYAPGAAGDPMWVSGPTGFTNGTSKNVGGTYTLTVADYTGDGYDDVYFVNAAAASLWKAGSTGFTSVAAPLPPGAATARPVAGNFVDDTRSDLFAYVPGPGPDTLYAGKATGL